MKKILTIVTHTVATGAMLLLMVLPMAATVAVVTPTQTYAAAPSVVDKCGAPILGIRPWYYGLTDGQCKIAGPVSTDKNGLSVFVWAIVLNCIDAVLTLAAYIAILLIMYGGFLFITGGGVASQIEKARKTIFNAVIGLVISMGAIGLVRFVFGAFGTAAAGETAENLPKFTGAELLKTGFDTAYFIAGLIAVLVIILGGINYVTSGGDSGKVSKAKNMITYAVAGLVVVLAAFAITNFIMRSFAQ